MPLLGAKAATQAITLHDGDLLPSNPVPGPVPGGAMILGRVYRRINTIGPASILGGF